MKRIAALRDLSDDHHTGLLLARWCKRVGRPGAAVEADRAWEHLRAAFVQHLAPHFAIEERHLVPALRALGETAHADRLLDDHADLRGRLADSGRAALVAFGERLEAHIRYEERRLFAETQDRLDAATLEAIVADCADVPRACPTLPNP